MKQNGNILWSRPQNYHTFRLTDEEEQNFRKLMKKYGYTSISSFIRDAILDRKLKVVVYQHPVKYDHTHSIRQLMTNIMTLDKRWIRAEKEFMDAVFTKQLFAI